MTPLTTDAHNQPHHLPLCWKMERGLLERCPPSCGCNIAHFYTDEQCEWFLDLEAQWRKAVPRWSHAQARAAFGLNPPADAIRRVDGTAPLDRNTILEKVDMVRLIEQYCQPPYRQYGDRMTVRCPWHVDQRPSMTVYLKSKRVWCFVCNDGGTAIDLLIKSDGIGFKEALEKLNAIL